MGERDLSGLLLDTPAGARTLPVDGLFEAIGQIPQNEPFAASLRLDQNGYIVASEDCRTSAPHIYAAGDCRTKTVRQLTTAAADGSSAALSAIAICRRFCFRTKQSIYVKHFALHRSFVILYVFLSRVQ